MVDRGYFGHRGVILDKYEKIINNDARFHLQFWMMFATVNQSTFHNRVKKLQMLRLRKGIVKIGVQSHPTFFIEILF